jgi:hypothetical protein
VINCVAIASIKTEESEHVIALANIEKPDVYKNSVPLVRTRFLVHLQS